MATEPFVAIATKGHVYGRRLWKSGTLPFSFGALGPGGPRSPGDPRGPAEVKHHQMFSVLVTPEN